MAATYSCTMTAPTDPHTPDKNCEFFAIYLPTNFRKHVLHFTFSQESNMCIPNPATIIIGKQNIHIEFHEVVLLFKLKISFEFNNALEFSVIRILPLESNLALMGCIRFTLCYKFYCSFYFSYYSCCTGLLSTLVLAELSYDCPLYGLTTFNWNWTSWYKCSKHIS